MNLKHLNTQSAENLTPPAVLLATGITAQAQFSFTTKNGAIGITGHYGPGGAVAIRNTING